MNQPWCSSTDDWMRKMWYIHTVKYCSAIKGNGVQSFTTEWMHPETITFNEISHSPKEEYIFDLWQLTRTVQNNVIPMSEIVIERYDCYLWSFSVLLHDRSLSTTYFFRYLFSEGLSLWLQCILQVCYLLQIKTELKGKNGTLRKGVEHSIGFKLRIWNKWNLVFM